MSRPRPSRRMAAALSALALIGAGLLTTGETASGTEPPVAGSTLPVAGSTLRSGAHPVRTGRLNGRVVSGTTPIHRATVTVHGRVHRTRLTGPAGRFHLRLRTGRYQVTVTAPGLTPEHLRVHVRSHHRTRRLVHLPPVPLVTLSGRVLDGSGHGWPLDARVSVGGTAGGRHLGASVETDPLTGRWSMRVPGLATYTISTVSDGGTYQPVITHVHIRLAAVANDVRMALAPAYCGLALGYVSLAPSGYGAPCRPVPGGLVAGRVTSGLTGAGLLNAQVTVGGSTVRSLSHGRSVGQPDGFYEAFSPPGSPTVSVTRPLYADAVRSVVVRPDAVSILDLPLDAGAVGVTPAAVSASVVQGAGPTTRTVTLTNTGSAPVTAHLTESRGADPAPGSAAPLPVGSAWQGVADLPVPTDYNATAVLDGVLYSVGGSVDVGGTVQPTAAGYAFRPGSGWSRIADLDRPLTDLTVGVVDDRLVVTGGIDVDDNGYFDTQVYDPGTDSWSAGEPVAQEKSESGQAVLGDSLYAIAGCFETGCGTREGDPSVEAYHLPDNTVSELASYPGGEEQPLCGGIDGRIYCTGGAYSNDEVDTSPPGPTSDSFAYDPTADAWSAIARPPVTIEVGAVAVADGRLVIAGGYQDGAPSNRVWAYDPSTDTWAELPALGATTSGAGGACGFYSVGGRGPAGLTPTVQRLTGYEACGDDGVDVGWLSLDQRTVTLAPGASTTVTVSLDPAGLEVGTHTAALRIDDDGPGTLPLIPITFDVVSPCLRGHRAGRPGVVSPVC